MSVYLDHAATTPLGPDARAAMEPYLSERFGNASEPHAYGRAARAALEAARVTLAELLDAEPGQVVLTSGGSEADNQAVFGLAGAEPGRIVVSAIEHPAVREPARELERRGFEVAWAPVDGDGVIDAEAFEALVRPGDRLAAAMWANNVTGAVQPVDRLASAAADARVPFHCDAVQAAASFPVGLRSSGAAFLALSAHKLGGPKGVGCLVAREPGRIPPLVWGGGQERGLRSGTENIPGAVGFAAALAATRAADDRRAALRERLEAALRAEITVVSAGAERLPGHLLALVPGIRAELLVLALDREGYAVAAGSACAAGDAEPSHVLVAQGMSARDARSVVRVSLGPGTTEAEVDGFAAAFAGCLGRLREGGLAEAV
ncbi:MAG TPA: cysteine desulfurase family protein [Gaiellales bacterium]|nr:cysteine desulfurase family protein [Gaiellales bacterium]